LTAILSAPKKEPILGLLLCIDLAEVRRILSEQEMPIVSDPVEARGMAFCRSVSSRFMRARACAV
jgi:hypothetical protein